MDALFTFLRKRIALNQNEENIICQFLKEKKIRKGHFLVKEDEISDRVFFIVKGLVKEYYFINNSKEFCTRFIAENEFFYSIRSFVNNVPAMRNLEVLEDTHVIFLTKSQLEHIYSLVPKTERFVRIVIEQYLVEAEHRAELREMASLEQPYTYFIETYK